MEKPRGNTISSERGYSYNCGGCGGDGDNGMDILMKGMAVFFTMIAVVGIRDDEV